MSLKPTTPRSQVKHQENYVWVEIIPWRSMKWAENHTASLVRDIFSLIWFDFLRPINNLSVIKGRVFLGWTVTKLGLMCLAQGHNAVTPVRLEPAAPRSWVKHSTTEPLRSRYIFFLVFCHVCIWCPRSCVELDYIVSSPLPSSLLSFTIKKIVSEYDQETPQSQTADNPVAPRGRAAQPSRDTRKTN